MAMEAPRWHHDGPGKFQGGSPGALENSMVEFSSAIKSPRWHHGGATVEFSMAMEAPRWHHDGPGKFHGGSPGALENSTVVIGLRVRASEVLLLLSLALDCRSRWNNYQIQIQMSDPLQCTQG